MTVKIDVLGVWQLVIVILLESRVRVNNLHCSCQLEAAELLPNLYIYIYYCKPHGQSSSCKHHEEFQRQIQKEALPMLSDEQMNRC